MGNHLGICQAITTPDIFVKLGSPKQQLQKFFLLYPLIKQTFLKTVQQSVIDNYEQNSIRKYFQGIYIGLVNSNTIPHTKDKSQKGIFLYQSGFLYYGQIKNGRRNGQGLLINEDGQFYEGQWDDNNPNGRGVYESVASNRKYQGLWVDGYQEGEGVQSYEDGTTYRGQFKKGVKEGKGRLEYPDKTVYDGVFMNNLMNGMGVSTGRYHRYEGQWENGKMHGNGISKWFDGEGNVSAVYVGQYEKGLKHGFGQYKWGDKKVYKGRFQQGDMISEGVLLNYEG